MLLCVMQHLQCVVQLCLQPPASASYCTLCGVQEASHLHSQWLQALTLLRSKCWCHG